MTMDLTDATNFRRQAERAMSMPLGLANPFWILFGAAATAGVTWWWVTRLARSAALEAMARESASIYEMAEATASTAPFASRGLKNRKVRIQAPDAELTFEEAETVYATPEAAGYPRVVLEPTVPPQARKARHESEIPAEASETPDSAGYPIVAPGPEAADAADDLTRIAGVGPRIAAALEAEGVTRFSQLAQWTREQLAEFDARLNLRGRALRSDWVEQARRFAAEANS
jgi:predicted flap endonuclease-1-like 5' DNA nuclease